MTLEERIEEALAEGYELIQEGRILMPPKERVSFSERAEGFRFSLLGPHSPPTFVSPYENKLLDDDQRWVHLRRDRRDS